MFSQQAAASSPSSLAVFPKTRQPGSDLFFHGLYNGRFKLGVYIHKAY